MPFVAVADEPTPALLAAADSRWAAIAANQPDLAPAVALQRQLVAEVLELAARIEQTPLPRLSLPPKYLAAKLGRGIPGLQGEPIPLPVPTIRPSLVKLLDILSKTGAEQAAGHIASLIDGGQLDPASLLNASFTRNQEAIRTGAVALGVAPDLLWLVAELALGPFAYKLQRTLFQPNDAALSGALAAWNEGYCLACGSWPALAEVANSHRVLRCSFCNLAWELNQYACIYCGDEGEAFVTAAPDVERKDRRLELCRTCGAYLKTVDVPAISPFPLLAIADLETMDLDGAAMEHRYSRPPLKEFAPR
jgi:FdhE protein